jgi:hypothetical protein
MFKYILMISILFSGIGFSYSDQSVTMTESEDKIFGLRAIKNFLTSEVVLMQISDFARESKDVRGVDELMDRLYVFIRSLLGERMGNLLIKLSGVPEIREHIFELYDHIKGISDPETCEASFTKAVSDIVFISAYIMAYRYLPIMVGTAANIVSNASILSVSLFNIDGRACKLIHGF